MVAKRIPFSVSARTARLIGRENVSNAEAAVIELVKNGYDADAEHVDIFFDKDDLYIVDNGCGMSEKVITDKWMVIGTDNKRVKVTTPKGRIVSGEKGIGRFALDKLGRAITMTSWTGNAGEPPIEWNVKWEDFEERNMTVDKVAAEITSKSPNDFKYLYKKVTGRNANHGTILHIQLVRDDWQESRLHDLFGSMRALVPPAHDKDFGITLKSSAYPKKWGLVEPLIAEAYDYRLEATYSTDDQKIYYKVYRNEFDIGQLEKKYQGVFNEPGMGVEPFDVDTFRKGYYEGSVTLRKALRTDALDKQLLDAIGTFSFDLTFAKISRPNDEDVARFPYKTVDYRERAGWLKKFGGIRIFRDNFRVRPYGEAGDDWLRLGERQAQSPGGAAQRLGGYRVRPNQVSGSIYISRLENKTLRDKSSREGIVENESFDLLKNIIKNMLSILEGDRNKVLYSLAQLYEKTNKNAQIEEEGKRALEEIKKERNEKDSDQRKDERSERTERVADYAEALRAKVNTKDEEIRLLRSLASAGIITAAAAHELNGLKNHMSVRMRQFDTLLSRYLDKSNFKTVAVSKNPFARIEQMADADVKIVSWLDYALMPLRRDRRTRKKVNMARYYADLATVWKPLLESRKISLDISTELSDNVATRLFPIDLDTIFNNLIINSMEAFLYRKSMQARHITIQVRQQEEKIIVEYQDNAGGLDESFLSEPEQIYLPHITTKVNALGEPVGTGMGMYLLKAVLDDNGGTPHIDTSDSNSFKMTIELLASDHE